MKRTVLLFASVAVGIVLMAGCASKRGMVSSQKAVAGGSTVAIVIDAPNKIKNVVLGKFIQKGFSVKAVTSADFYMLDDYLTVADFKTIGGSSKIGELDRQIADSLFKMNYYSYESSKADVLNDIKTKWGVRYLVLLEMQDWENTAWGRAIDLNSMELVWVENYPPKFNDSIESVTEHFMDSMSKK
jgi:hypothetical protein